MKAFTILIMAIGIMSILSCGPSAEEKAATEKAKADSLVLVEKTKMDSTAKATEQKIETKLALKDSVKKVMNDIEVMDYQLTDAKGELAAATDKLNSIKEFEIGRALADREKQIKNQTIIIDELEKKIEKLQNAIQQSEDQIKRFQTDLKIYE